jgi:16S rRNA (uracil1498-N3)-methyltransferase
MRKGESVQVSDGKGNVLVAEIINDHKKKCEAKILRSHFTPLSPRRVSIGISLLKNASRFEWFLEKATEIGVHQIIPLICERTEKQHIRYERLKNICISAMVQSQQAWLPDLRQPVSFGSLFQDFPHQQKFIAHCTTHEKHALASVARADLDSTVILIGPEGDFTNDEVELAIRHQCVPVSLGETRLRTETAGIVSASVLVIR